MYYYYLCWHCCRYYAQKWDRCPKCDDQLYLFKLTSEAAHEFREKYEQGREYK